MTLSEEVCAKCGGDAEWIDCYNCEEGYSHHDCGEDCCACIDPKPNVVCNICYGKGGWYYCPSCANAEGGADKIGENALRVGALPICRHAKERRRR